MDNPHVPTEKKHGFRSFLKKFHSSHRKKPASVSAQPVKVKVSAATNVKPKAKVIIAESDEISAASKKPSRREQAEKQLEDASKRLNETMSKVSGKLEVPDTIGLLNHRIDDVEGTARNLETQIDIIIDARRVNASLSSRQMWKNCVQGWFKAIYPYVNTCLKEVGVKSSCNRF